MVQNPNFWKDFPISSLQNYGLLSHKEKKLLKEITLKRWGDPHVYHPFLEKSIFKANNLNSNLRGTYDWEALVKD